MSRDLEIFDFFACSENGKRLSDYGIAAVDVDRIGDEERRVPSSAIAAQSAPSFTIYNQSFVDSVVPTSVDASVGIRDWSSVNASDWTSANASTSWTSSSNRSAADLACDDYAGNVSVGNCLAIIFLARPSPRSADFTLEFFASGDKN